MGEGEKMSFVVRTVAAAILVTSSSLGCSGADAGDLASPEAELNLSKEASIASSYAIKMQEVSGLTTRLRGGNTEVLAIGDASTNLAIATLENDDLRFGLHALPARSVQWEGIATDKSGKVIVLEESPGSLLVFDAELKQALQTIPLRFDEKTWSDTNSRGEGLVLLKNGHVLLLKEKDPQLIVEMGPAGDRPGGYAPGGAVGHESTFPLPAVGVAFVTLKEWGISDTTKGKAPKSAQDLAGDASELAVDRKSVV